MENRNEKFVYAYSAKQQEEIQNIRQKYISKEEDKLAELYRLDQKATQMGTIISIIMGSISTLIFGFGMSCTMVWEEDLFFWGIIIGLVGLIGISLAYPVYKYVTRKQREKLAPQILKLTDELMSLK